MVEQELKSLDELLKELDNVIREVQGKKTNFYTTESKSREMIANAKISYDNTVREEENKITQAQRELTQASDKARSLQKQIQERTTSFLADNTGRIRTSS